MAVSRRDRRDWHEGPIFEYRAAGKKIRVNVTGSSWPIRGLEPAHAVRDVLREFRKLPGQRVLDFGAGSWLRYVNCVQKLLSTREVYAVEFDEAFRDDALQVRRQHEADVTFWAPGRFASMRTGKFDLIILVNVLNTMPEEHHQHEVFSFLSNVLNPLGWLVVYQRIWVESENPSGAFQYGDGWLVPQARFNHYTYRAKTGAKWFNQRADECKLKPVDIKTDISSSNTLLRVWEKRFE